MSLPLTKGDRERTTLLLRCAAEVAVTEDCVWPGRHAASRLGFSQRTCKRACSLATKAVRYVARAAGRNPYWANDLDEYLAVVLEAANCVEDP